VAAGALGRGRDGAAAIAAVAEGTGVEPLVVSHEEEGYLTLLGVTAGRRVPGQIGVIDVGGGSSEVVFVGPGEPAHAGGIKVGSGRLTAQYGEHDPPTRDA